MKWESLIGFTLLTLLSCGNSETYKADVIIYGGTSAAVTAAVEVIQSGKTAILVSPDIHIGGLSSGGLGFTDTGNKATIGGLSREFYHRVWLHYNDTTSWKWEKHDEYGNKGQGTPAMDGANRTMWIFEPHVAEKVFEDFINEYKIPIYRDEWLNRETGVVTNNGKIISITTISGKTFKGKMFIDATYEGDLMASAGVTYTVGREACSNIMSNGTEYRQVYITTNITLTQISVPTLFKMIPTAGSCRMFQVNPFNPIARAMTKFRHTVSDCA